MGANDLLEEGFEIPTRVLRSTQLKCLNIEGPCPIVSKDETNFLYEIEKHHVNINYKLKRSFPFGNQNNCPKRTAPDNAALASIPIPNGTKSCVSDSQLNEKQPSENLGVQLIELEQYKGTSSEKESKPKKRKRRKAKKKPPPRIVKLRKLREASALNQRNRRKCFKISRTVEIIDQTDESWRDEKSKLLFMVGLGLTPILNKPACATPIINLDYIPVENLDETQTKLEKQWLLDYKEKNKNIEKIRQQLERVVSLKEQQIPVIDLSSDGEDSSEEIEKNNAKSGDAYLNETTKHIPSKKLFVSVSPEMVLSEEELESVAEMIKQIKSQESCSSQDHIFNLPISTTEFVDIPEEEQQIIQDVVIIYK